MEIATTGFTPSAVGKGFDVQEAMEEELTPYLSGGETRIQPASLYLLPKPGLAMGKHLLEPHLVTL